MLTLSTDQEFQLLEITTSIPTPNQPSQFSVLSANVGNSDLRCHKYFWKLCLSDVEENISKNIAILEPDIVSFQELLPYSKCEDYPTLSPTIICSHYSFDTHQAERILGEKYTIVCDTQLHMQCIAVKAGFGSIEGCPISETCFSGKTITATNGCDENFTIFSVTILPNNGERFDVVNVHLNSRKQYCRSAAFEKIFDENLLQNPRIIIIGDFNTNLLKASDNASKIILELLDNIGPGQPVTNLLSVHHTSKPPNTFEFGWFKTTLDFAFSNFLNGDMIVLGQTQDTDPLDGGWGMDHFALYGVFSQME
jgi:exonuclease III